MAEQTEVIEADVKSFQKELEAKEAKVLEMEKKYLQRLVKEAKEANVDMKEDELLSIGEKGILALIEQAKKLKVPEKMAVQENKGKGIVVNEAIENLYEPEWAEGPIYIQEIGGEKTMFRNWNYDYWRCG